MRQHGAFDCESIQVATLPTPWRKVLNGSSQQRKRECKSGIKTDVVVQQPSADWPLPCGKANYPYKAAGGPGCALVCAVVLANTDACVSTKRNTATSRRTASTNRALYSRTHRKSNKNRFCRTSPEISRFKRTCYDFSGHLL